MTDTATKTRPVAKPAAKPPATARSLNAPIADFAVAPENPRAERDVENAEALTANIKAFGVLQPVIVYTAGGVHYVTAGRRRLACARAAGLDVLPYIALARTEAIEAGLAEQTNHVEMHVADQVRAFSKMAASGVAPAAIANAFGLTVTQVRQRVALGDLAKPIFEALAADEIDLREARIYANADPKRQVQLWKSFGRRGQHWRAREALVEGRVDSKDPLALFVGLKAYSEAGGEITNDLFAAGYRSEDGEEGTIWLEDRKLLQKLADEKIEAALARYRKQGWGFAEMKAHDWYDAFNRRDRPKLKADRAALGVLVTIGQNGKLETDVVEARTKAAKTRTATAGAKAKRKADGKAPPMTNRAHEQLSRAAQTLLARRLAEDPQLALTAICAELARQRWAKDRNAPHQSILKITEDWNARARSTDAPAPRIEAELKRAATAETYWRSKFSKNLDDAETVIAQWIPNIRTKFLGFLVSGLVDIAERHTEGASIHADRRKRIAALMANDKLAPADLFTPTPEILAGFSTAELHAACKALGIDAHKRKKDTAAAVAEAAAAQRWLPQGFLDMLGRKADAAAAKSAKKKPAAKAPKRAPARRRSAKR